MSGMLAVMERELRGVVRSPVALAVLGVYLALHGLFFAQLMEEYSARSFSMMAEGVLQNQQNLIDMVVRPLVMGDAYLLLILLPAVSMRALADEWRQGTIDLLMSYPLRESDVVLGKFLGAFVVMIVLILLGAIYPALTAILGNLEVQVLLTGLLGLAFYGATVLAAGMLFSSLTENQVIAFVSTVLTLMGVAFVGWWGGRVEPPWSDLLSYFSLTGHVDPSTYGVLQASDFVFFTSLTGLFLYLTVGVLESKRWRKGVRG